MKAASLEAVGNALLNCFVAYTFCFVAMIILAAALQGVGTPNYTAGGEVKSWCQSFYLVQQRNDDFTHLCDLCCSTGSAAASCASCACSQRAAPPNISQTSNVCDPSIGCTVCAACCHDYIVPGQCSRCVQTQCPVKSLGLCGFSDALW